MLTISLTKAKRDMEETLCQLNQIVNFHKVVGDLTRLRILLVLKGRSGMWKDVYEEFSELTKSDQMALFEAMKEDLFPDEPDKITKLLKTIREARFSSGMDYVHCGSTSVKRNGKYRTRKRYLCKDCNKTFNDMTNTPFRWFTLS
jgi:hypothetical protein